MQQRREGSGEIPRKRAYEKPVVRRVPLRPDEAVLGKCKTSNTGGPLHGTCSTIPMCNTVGS
jgi:hypothetical protein